MEKEMQELIWKVKGKDDKERILRIKRAKSERFEIKPVKDGFSVKNENGKEYFVKIDGNKGFCTCPDFQKRGRKRKIPCKHLYRVYFEMRKQSYEKTTQYVFLAEKTEKVKDTEIKVSLKVEGESFEVALKLFKSLKEKLNF